MDCRAVAFRQLPHQPRLFLDFLDRYERVKPFFPHPPTIPAVGPALRELDYPADRRRQIVKILRRQNEAAGLATQQNLDRLERGAAAVVSGQQVGLFGGPAYSFYKALSAAQVAQELTAQGVEAVPIFWMATEDHDVDEVRSATFFENGELVRFELPAPSEGAQPVGRISLGERAVELAAIAAGFLENAGGSDLAQVLRNAYRAEDTYGTAFARLFADLFSEQGLILVDPLDRELHRAASPVYRRVVEDGYALTQQLLERSKDLEKAGYQAQVRVTAKSALLFHLAASGRHAITPSNGKFKTPETSWTAAELAAAVSERPEEFSPNALLRPVVQDYLFPTVAYIGGPAEICYFAQSEVLYRNVLGRMPAVLPRAGFTLVDAKAAKLLRKYSLEVEDLWLGPQALRKRMEGESVPKGLARNFDRDHAQINNMLKRLGAQIEKLDPTLAGAVETAQNKIGYQLENLKLKTGRALNERTGFIAQHQQYLESLLYPQKQLQSRELNLLSFLAKAPGALTQLQSHASGKQLGHHFIIELQ